MNEIIKKYTGDYFGALISKFGFEIKSEIVSEESYLMEYASKSYIIKIEKYHQEFYTTVYSSSDQNKEINISNLLEFLKQENSSISVSEEYFRAAKNIKECYKKQLKHISNIIYSSLDLLNDFFSKEKYKKNINELDNYWRSKYPELYRTL